MKKLTDQPAFFNLIRKGALLGPALTTVEVEGLNAILEACGEADWPLSYTAYALATAYHETAGSMKPIKEYGGNAYYTKMYDITGSRPEMAKKNGNTTPGDGAKYCGRGWVQLTWKNNYIKAEKKIPIPGLVANPDKAMEVHNASKIMISGMSQGWFSGVGCDDFLPAYDPATVAQFTKARKIINGTDKAAKIAAEAVHFQDALTAGKWA